MINLPVAAAFIAILLAVPAYGQEASAVYTSDGTTYETTLDISEPVKRVGRLVNRLLGELSCSRLEQMEKAAAKSRNYDTKLIPTYAVSYGAQAAQTIDVYAPPTGASLSHAPYPVIMVIHGGAWCIGSKSAHSVVTNKALRWIPRGFIVASVEYRMLPDGADVLTQAQDVAAAIAYVQEHAQEWGGNPDEIIVMGHSAGAHLVSLLGADRNLSAQYGVRPWLGTISLDSAATDVAEMMRYKHPAFYDEAFGADQKYWQETSPIERLSGSSVPWLGVCSTLRPLACSQAHAYVEKSLKNGIRAAVLAKDMNHGEINNLLGVREEYTGSVEEFMKSLSTDIKYRLER